MLAELNRHRDPGDQIRHFDPKYLNNRIEGGSFGAQPAPRPDARFQNATISQGHPQRHRDYPRHQEQPHSSTQPGSKGEIEHLHKLFGLAA